MDASGSEAVTAAYETRIRTACDSLVNFPDSYPPWRYSPSLRMMPVAKYCVFYRIVGDTVRVVHIRYAGRAPSAHGSTPHYFNYSLPELC